MATLRVTYVESSFSQFHFTNCDAKLTLAGLQCLILDHIEVGIKDQQIMKVVSNALTELTHSDTIIFDAGQHQEILLLNRAITSESKLKDLEIFSAKEDCFLSHTIDLKNIADVASTYSKRYDHINIGATLIQSDISENFNFKPIMSQQSVVKRTFESLDIIQLQTFEQLFFNNFTKIKNSFRRFKGLSKDCISELR